MRPPPPPPCLAAAQVLAALPVDLAALRAARVGAAVLRLSSRAGAGAGAGAGGNPDVADLDPAVVALADDICGRWIAATNQGKAAGGGGAAAAAPPPPPPATAPPPAKRAKAQHASIDNAGAVRDSATSEYEERGVVCVPARACVCESGCSSRARCCAWRGGAAAGSERVQRQHEQLSGAAGCSSRVCVWLPLISSAAAPAARCGEALAAVTAAGGHARLRVAAMCAAPLCLALSNKIVT